MKNLFLCLVIFVNISFAPLAFSCPDFSGKYTCEGYAFPQFKLSYNQKTKTYKQTVKLKIRGITIKKIRENYQINQWNASHDVKGKLSKFSQTRAECTDNSLTLFSRANPEIKWSDLEKNFEEGEGEIEEVAVENIVTENSVTEEKVEEKTDETEESLEPNQEVVMDNSENSSENSSDQSADAPVEPEGPRWVFVSVFTKTQDGITGTIGEASDPKTTKTFTCKVKAKK